MPPHIVECAGDVAHHVQQEGIGLDFQHDKSALPAHHTLIHASYGGERLTPCRAYGGEVLFAQQSLRRAMHGVRIEQVGLPGPVHQ